MKHTIKLEKETKRELGKLKVVDRETYDSVIQRMLKTIRNIEAYREDENERKAEMKASQR